MSEPTFTFLIPVDDCDEMRDALRYAARRAHLVKGRVALLYVVESQEIETWGGVERAMADEAFDKAREEMVQYEQIAENLSGFAPILYFAKGNPRAALLDLIKQEPHISVVVLSAQTKNGARNPLVNELTSERELRKLTVPLTIVPGACRCDDSEVCLKPLLKERADVHSD